jgi:hypothetical protein
VRGPCLDDHVKPAISIAAVWRGQSRFVDNSSKISASSARNLARAIGCGGRTMDRCRDYLRFAIRFTGLGYILLWPLSTPDRGNLFGASLLCAGRSLLDIVCRLPHPLHFGVGLHATGALCALLALASFAFGAVRRSRRRGCPATPAGASTPTSAAAAIGPAPKRARRRTLPPPRRDVPPRTQFGLRGVPH